MQKYSAIYNTDRFVHCTQRVWLFVKLGGWRLYQAFYRIENKSNEILHYIEIHIYSLILSHERKFTFLLFSALIDAYNMHKHFISSASIRLSALLTLTEDYSGLNMMGLGGEQWWNVRPRSIAIASGKKERNFELEGVVNHIITTAWCGSE